MKDKQKRKKERTWAEAARLVLENYSDAPMTPKQILQVIEAEGLKEMSGTSPLACLNAMLHSNSRGGEGLFYKLPGRISLFTLKKDALQWSRNPAVVEGEEPEDTADAESCGSNEASTVSGENDVSLDETSSNASCSTESQSRPLSNPRDSCRAASQANKQKKKTGVMLPRVVLTPLKVNGAHVESAAGFSGRHADGESGSPSSSSSGSLALGSTAIRGQAEVTRDPAPLLRGFRKPATGQMKRNRGEEIDFETPGSILVNTNLRALINTRTFHALPSSFQQQLLFLLPEVDRQVGTDGLLRLSSSALNNEFFTHAAQSWRERLADGEFTHEMQVRIRQEMEKEKKVEQWKEKFFEDYYGQKLGLTKEEPLPQTTGQEEAGIKSGVCVAGETARLQRALANRQRDGHFKKRSRPDLRTRARRNLYKKQEPEAAAVATDGKSVASDTALYREEEAKTSLVGVSNPHLPGTSSPEGLEVPAEPAASQIQTEPGNVVCASVAADRIPSLPQETGEPEPKDQKRKSFEQAASASFPEKKPRLEDRQSFRNTIESVHAEKPEPTKEEPKVPPIRIQLSRIKPPWVVKGQPAYQICPRVVPVTEPSSRGRPGARTLADIKARALQARAQRAAATTAIGGGGGPGGGGSRATDEGGGRGSGAGDGGEACGHPELSGAQGTPGACASDLQRAQLLPPHPVSREQALVGPAATTRREDKGPWQQGASVEDASQPHIAPTGDQPYQALPPLSSQTPGAQPVAEQLRWHLDVRTECGSGAMCSERVSEEHGPLCPRENGPVQALVQDVVPHEGPGQVRVPDPTLKDPINVTPSLAPGLSLAACLPDRPLADPLELGSLCPSPERESATRQRDLKAKPLTPDAVAPRMTSLSSDQGATQPGPSTGEKALAVVESSAREGWEAAYPHIPAFLGKSTADKGLCPPEHLPVLWAAPTPGPGSADGACSLVPSGKLHVNGDSEAPSPHSESTDTASDFEVSPKGASSEPEAGEATREKGAWVVDKDGKQAWIPPSTSLSTRDRDPGAITRTDAMGGTQTWVSRVCTGPQKTPNSLLLASAECQLRPTCLDRPGSSVEASSPLVMQLLQGHLALEKMLPPAQRDSKPESLPPPLQKMPSHGGTEGLGTLPGSGGDSHTAGQSSPGSPRALMAPPLPHKASTVLKGQEAAQAPGGPLNGAGAVPSCPAPRTPVTNQAASSGKLEEMDPKECPSSFGLEEQKASQALSQRSRCRAAPGRNPGTLTTSRAPSCSSPGAAASGPDQAGQPLGGQGKKLLGSKSGAAALPGPRPVEPAPPPADVPPGVPGQQLGPSKGFVAGGTLPASAGSTKPEKSAVGGSLKMNAENSQVVRPSPLELMERLQGMPFVMDLPFWKLPRKESGKGLAQPLEPSSLPSQLNIKQALYGKLSKLQLSSTSFHHASGSPTFAKGLAGSVVQLNRKASFGASRSTSVSLQMFAANSGTMERLSLQCACSLRAMTVCRGCGAFCHDGCIGPSELCVLCLVVR